MGFPVPKKERLNGKKILISPIRFTKEIGTIGAGRAATALSELLSKRVEITVPLVNFVPLENIANLLKEREAVFVIDMEMEGDLTGRMFLLFPPDDAKNLSGALLGQPGEQINLQDEMLQSSLKRRLTSSAALMWRPWPI